MKYQCKIADMKEEDEVTIVIHGVIITGFSNQGVSLDIGVETEVDIELYGELVFSKSSAEEPCVERMGNSLSYFIRGVLHVDERKIGSVIDFGLEPEDLYDYGFLDGEMVEVEVLRLNLAFEESKCC